VVRRRAEDSAAGRGRKAQHVWEGIEVGGELLILPASY